MAFQRQEVTTTRRPEAGRNGTGAAPRSPFFSSPGRFGLASLSSSVGTAFDFLVPCNVQL